MDAQEEMQKIVEAAGECWNDTHMRFCGASDTQILVSKPNPSPTDLNELVRLAEKLYGRDCRIEFSMHYGDVQAIQLCKENKVVSQGQADTKADALRTALVKATEGK